MKNIGTRSLDAQERRRQSKPQKVVLSIVFVLFLLYALSLIFPLVWAFLVSFKTNRQFFESPLSLWPREWHVENYKYAFDTIVINGKNLIDMFANSLFLAIGGSVVAIFASSMTAYVISKYRFPLRNFLYSVAIFSMIIPIVGNLPSMYKLVTQLGIKNNIFGILLLYAGGFGFNFIVMYGYFKSIPWSYAEAAFMDGATDFQVFTKIMIPMAKGPMVSLGLISAIGIWNDYTTPFLYLDENPTLALGIYEYGIITRYRSDYPLYFAAIIMSIIPVLLIFILFQKTIMENTTAGGLKG